MRRDMDLIRDILLQIEGGRHSFEILSVEECNALGIADDDALPQEEADKWEHNLGLIQGAGFVDFERTNGGWYPLHGLTWAGHDFLDSVRDPEIWRQTKTAAGKAGSFTVELLVGLAKAYAKAKLATLTGLALDA